MNMSHRATPIGDHHRPLLLCGHVHHGMASSSDSGFHQVTITQLGNFLQKACKIVPYHDMMECWPVAMLVDDILQRAGAIINNIVRGHIRP